MLVRLTRTKRLKAGWLIALAYLLCVLAPTISYALPGLHTPAACLTDANHVAGMVHFHSGSQHIHKDGHVHDHAAAQGHSGDDHSMSETSDSSSLPEKAPHSSDGQCCGLICVTALPATVVDIMKPYGLPALRKAERYRNVVDNAPPRLYRPPIS